MKSVGTKIAAGFGIAMVLLIALGFFAFVSTRRLVHTQHQDVQTSQAIEKLESILYHVEDAEAEQRGFIITGQDRYLEPFNETAKQIRQDLKELRDLTRDRPRQQASLDQIEKLITGKRVELQETIDLRRGENGFQPALQVILADRGKKIMDDVRRAITEMQGEEREFLKRQSQETDVGARNTTYAILWGVPIAVLLLGVAAFLIARHISRPLKSITAMAERISSNGLTTELPFEKRDDEIGHLGNAFAAMIHSLKKMTTDITTGAEALRKSEERLQLAQQAGRIGTFDWDTRTNQVTWTAELEALYGLAPGDFGGNYRNWEERVHPEDLPRVRQAFHDAVRDKSSIKLEFRILWPDGSTRWIAAQGRIICNEQGEPLRMIGVNRDITDRKEAEESLQAQRSRLETILQYMPAGVAIAEAPSGKLLFGNDELERLAEHPFNPSQTIQEYRDWTVLDLHGRPLPPEQYPLARVILKGESCRNEECIIERADGTRIFVSVNAAPIRDSAGKIIAGVATVFDITDRKRAEEAVRESEEKYRSLFENSLDGILLATPEGKITEANPAACEMFGMSKEELCEAGRSGVMDTEDPRLAPAIEERDRVGSVKCELTCVRKDETKFPVELTSVLLRSRTITPRAFVIVRDITQRVRAQEALKQSEERFQSLSSATFEGIAISEGGRLTDANEQFFRMFGYDRDELIGQEISTFIYPEDRGRVMANILQGIESHIEHRMRRKDGSVLTVEAHGKTAAYHNRQVRFTAVRDITERKRAEEELRQTLADLARSNKDLEQFAYVSSHDLQEPLRMVVSHLQLIERRYKDTLDQGGKEILDFAIEGAARMQSLIEGLLNYSRIGTQGKAMAPSDMGAVVERALENLDVLIHETGAAIAVAALPTVYADADQLTQLFQNLIGNAIKYRQADRKPEIEVGAQRQEGLWQFWVKDNGIGIEPEYFHRIFMIFQRLHTRAEYAGTGIGLAICRRIVERHGGTIWVESRPGEGATFFFTVPDRQTASSKD